MLSGVLPKRKVKLGLSFVWSETKHFLLLVGDEWMNGHLTNLVEDFPMPGSFYQV